MSSRTHTPFAGRARRLPVAQAAALALLVTGAAAQAQQADAKKDDGKVETVVITATKRLQPLQSTPIAVTAISGSTLEQANLNNLETISTTVPTVNFRTNASNKDSALFVRGVGTISTSPGVEPTVSTVLDGVVTARPGQATLDLVEIDRIEILRGPQGTLFGKNASAGVINIVSRAPSKELSGFIDMSVFQGTEMRLRAGVSGEMAPNLVRGSLSAMVGKYDGNVLNVYDGRKVNGYDRQGMRGRLDVTPNKDVKITVLADHAVANDTPPTGVAYSTNVRAYPSNAVTANPNFALAIAPVVPAPENRHINSDMLTNFTDTNQGLSAQVDWTVGSSQITSITARRKWSNEQFQDQDRLGRLFRGFNRLADRGQLDFDQYSQELRVASTQKAFLEYVAGLFYMQGNVVEQYRRDSSNCAASTDPALPNGLVPCTATTTVTNTGIADYGVRSKSASVFGEGTLNFTSRFRAIAGLRYTMDDLSYHHGRQSTASAPGVGATRATVRGSTDESAVSGRVGPQFDFSKDIMGYATLSRGYKGPAYNVFFNMSATQDNVLAPETSNSVELGLKSTLAGGTVRANLALFSTEYDGYQANVPDLVNGVIVTRLINAGKVSTKGAELDLTARITPQFTTTLALAYTQARVKAFSCPPGAAASCDINGKPLPFAPDWKGSLRMKYVQPIGNTMTMEFSGDASHQSKVNFDLSQQPDSVQEAYTIVNATVSLVSDAGWRVSLLGKNLGDKSYATFKQSSGNHINRYVPRDDTRYFGINVRYDF